MINENQIQKSAPVEALSSRWMEEVKGAIFMGKQFPRDQEVALNRILQSCRRKTLAEKALYTYQRGGETVEGPSIRLAEAIAQNWGNLSSGVIELEQKNGESNCMSYAWDLETNFRDDKIFTVKHERYTKSQGMKKLTDPRDIYELVANMGARRKRACILAVIPGDIIEAAITECKETILKDGKPLAEKITDLVKAFDEFKVTGEMIKKRFEGKKITEKEYLDLLGVFNAIKDGISKPSEFFPDIKETTSESSEKPLTKLDLELKNS